MKLVNKERHAVVGIKIELNIFELQALATQRMKVHLAIQEYRMDKHGNSITSSVKSKRELMEIIVQETELLNIFIEKLIADTPSAQEVEHQLFVHEESTALAVD